VGDVESSSSGSSNGSSSRTTTTEAVAIGLMSYNGDVGREGEAGACLSSSKWSFQQLKEQLEKQGGWERRGYPMRALCTHRKCYRMQILI
jgi:hypothetical protein